MVTIKKVNAMKNHKLARPVALLSGFTAVVMSVATTLSEGDTFTRVAVGTLLVFSVVLLAYKK